jgi:choline kinase
MKAIILAAGQGSRLRPVTDNMPKCMVPIGGKPMVRRQLDLFHSKGINDVMLVGGYRIDALEPLGVPLTFNPDFASTNMVYTLFCAESWMDETQDLIISYGDIVYEPAVLHSLLATDAPIVTAIDKEWRRLWELRMDDPLTDAETLKLVDGNRIVEVGKKPQSYNDIQGQYIGLIKIRKDTLALAKAAWHGFDRSRLIDGNSWENMYMTSFLQYLIDRGVDVRAAFIENGWIEVDTVADLNHYESMYVDGSLSSIIDLAV